MSLNEKADSSRFVTFRLVRPSFEQEKRNKTIEFSESEVQQFGLDLMVFAIKHAQTIIKITNELSKEAIGSHSIRQIEAIAVPAALLEMLENWQRSQTIAFIDEVLTINETKKTEEAVDEQQKLFQDIICSRICTNFSGEMAVYEAVKIATKEIIGYSTQEEQTKQDVISTLGRNGIIWKKRKQEIGFVFSMIKTQLLKNTKWEKMNIGEILARLKFGHVSNIKNCENVSLMGFSVDPKIITEYLQETETEELQF